MTDVWGRRLFILAVVVVVFIAARHELGASDHQTCVQARAGYELAHGILIDPAGDGQWCSAAGDPTNGGVR